MNVIYAVCARMGALPLYSNASPGVSVAFASPQCMDHMQFSVLCSAAAENTPVIAANTCMYWINCMHEPAKCSTS